MNNYRWLQGLAALVISGATLACGGDASPAAAPAAAVPATSMPATAVPPTAVPPTTAPAPAAAEAAQVAAVDNRFDPPSVEVARGTTVRWTNRGQEEHDVASEDVTSFGSPLLKTGQTFEFVATAPGTFKYLCTVHENMTGTLVVK